MKITQLPGSEILPQKVSRLCLHTDNNEDCIPCMCHDLINNTVSSLKKVELAWDEEKMAKLIHEINMANPWEYLSEQSRNIYRNRTKSLIQSQHLFLSLRRSE